jgi:ABC-type phosphate/phosphonate transport system substrate-binding protein
MNHSTRLQKNTALTFSVLASLLLSAAASANPTPDLVLSAPPRGKAEAENKIYQPVAEYLSKATGRKIVYRHIDNWLSYQSEMQKGKIDIVFDGPHFVSWRMAAIQHEPVAKLPGKLAFVAVVKAGDREINDTSDLAGRMVCAFAPPNLATLTFLAEFENPARQPRIVNVESFPQAYKQMLSGKCRAAVLRDVVYKKLDGEAKKGRVVFQSGGVANQAFSAGPRLNADEKSKIARALVAPEASTAIKAFLDSENQGKSLLPASIDEYRKHARLLKDVWGFTLKTAEADQLKPARGDRPRR